MKNQDTTDILSLIEAPAFLVKDGIVHQINTAARAQMIQEDTPISDYLLSGIQEYRAFREGCLYLTLSISEKSCAATVSKLGQYHIFVLEPMQTHAALQAMALAAEELRGPLSDIMAITERIFPTSELNQDPNTVNQMSRINKSLYQMLRVISNMSDTYRYHEEFKQKLEVSNLCQLVRDILEKCETVISETGIRLTYDLPKENIFCPLDTEKVERALYNMLSNAIKFTPKDGTVHVQLSRKQNLFYLTVEDTGSGIAKHLLNSFHNRFRRAPALEDSLYGIGLGMVLIQCAAAAHQGAVLVQQTGHGTRITLTLKMLYNSETVVRSDILRIDYAGERDHCLIELSDTLPTSVYEPEHNR